MIPAACDQIIVHLIEHDYLNEERYARSYARGKFRVKYWGRHRIKNELRYRGISPANIKLAMEEIPSDEYYTRLDELARRKLTSISSDNLQKKRRKLANYLQYRGWESALVYDKINELIPF
jgi:regulatory protein